jgi:hypothetical protein
MTRRSGAQHVVRIKSKHVNAAGQERVYESTLLRRTYRQDGKVKNQTMANLSDLPAESVDLLAASLKGQSFVPADAAVAIGRSLPHGHVAAAAAMARKLGLPELLGPACRERDLAYALILSRVVRPASKLATACWWADTTLAVNVQAWG